MSGLGDLHGVVGQANMVSYDGTAVPKSRSKYKTVPCQRRYVTPAVSRKALADLNREVQCQDSEAAFQARANQEAVNTFDYTLFALISFTPPKRQCTAGDHTRSSSTSHQTGLRYSEILRVLNVATSGRRRRVPGIGDFIRRASLCERRSFFRGLQ